MIFDGQRYVNFLCMFLGAMLLGHGLVAAQDGSETDRPNVLWIMSEDNSADYLKHFDPAGAPAPN
ncbi:MAG: hypothetical protein AAF802_28355, partial [Planctomycetota bacterium]